MINYYYSIKTNQFTIKAMKQKKTQSKLYTPNTNNTHNQSSLPWKEIYFHVSLVEEIRNMKSIPALLERLHSGETSRLEKLRNIDLYSMRIKQGSNESSRMILKPYQIAPNKQILVIVAIVENHNYEKAFRSYKNSTLKEFSIETLEPFYINNTNEVFENEIETSDLVIHNNSMIKVSKEQSQYLSSILERSEMQNYILSGAPGTGKTLIASLLLGQDLQNISEDQMSLPLAAAADDQKDSDSAAAADKDEQKDGNSAAAADNEQSTVMIYIALNQKLLDSMEIALKNHQYSNTLSRTRKHILLLTEESFLRLPELPCNTQMVLVDEYQNYTEESLKNIKEIINAASNNLIKTIYFGDTDQTFVTTETTNKLNFLKKLYIHEIHEFKLMIPYRCSPEIKKLLYQVIHLRQNRLATKHGSTMESMNTQTDGDIHRKGLVYFTTKIDRLKKFKGTINYLVIISNEGDREEAEKIFDATLIFTLESVQGLEVKNVVLYNMFDILAKNNETPVPEQSYNKLIVAISRASDKVAIFQSHQKNAIKIREALEIIENTEDLDISDKDLTLEDYKEKIIYWINNENIQAAKLVSERFSERFSDEHRTDTDSHDKEYLYNLCIEERKKEAEQANQQAEKANQEPKMDARQESDREKAEMAEQQKNLDRVIKEKLANKKAKAEAAREEAEKKARQEAERKKQKEEDLREEKSEALLTFIKEGDFRSAYMLINEGIVDIFKCNNGTTILHYLAEHPTLPDYINLVNLVFNKINEMHDNNKLFFLDENNNNKECTALNAAIRKGNFFIASKLINVGADISIKDIQNGTILHYITKPINTPEYRNFVNLVFEKIDKMPIGTTKTDFLNTYNLRENSTHLMMAIKEGNFFFARKLINAGADISIKNIGGITILHLLCKPINSPEYREFVNLVFEKIAKMPIGTKKMDFLNTYILIENSTHLIMAIKEGNFLLASKLLNAGADISTKSINGITIFNFLSVHDNSKEYKDLVDKVFEKIDTIKRNPSMANFICEIIKKTNYPSPYLIVKINTLRNEIMEPSEQNKRFLSSILKERANSTSPNR
jgi:ankyrin repeat protein